MKQKEKDNIFEDEMLLDAAALSSVDTETTQQLSGLVKLLGQVQQDIMDAEEKLKLLKQEKQRISFEVLHSLMDQMGIERVDVDGATVQLKPFVKASIPADRKQEAYNWLREHNLDDIIKNDVTVSFNRGEDNIASDVMYELEQKGFHPEKKTHIHAMTLNAFVKERVEKGLPIVLDMFGAFVARTADVRRKK